MELTDQFSTDTQPSTGKFIYLLQWVILITQQITWKKISGFCCVLKIVFKWPWHVSKYLETAFMEYEQVNQILLNPLKLFHDCENNFDLCNFILRKKFKSHDLVRGHG